MRTPDLTRPTADSARLSSVSRRAYDLLNNWPEERGKFIKVFPVEYRHALAMHSCCLLYTSRCV